MEGRDQQAAEFLFATLDEQQLAQVEAVAVDMAGFYVAAAQAAVPQAAIVHDKFHIAKHLGEAVDKVRRQRRTKSCWLRAMRPSKAAGNSGSLIRRT